MTEYGIELHNLTKKYNSFLAVDQINLNIRKGHLFGFLGPNGAGKSTTLNMLSTILPPTSGTALIEGYDIVKQRQQVRELIGICPQEIVVYDLLTARENIHLIAQLHKMPPKEYKERTDELLGRMNLLDRADDLVKKYSGGMKRRVNVLMAVVHDPTVCFFDEPSAGLDPQSRRVVWDFIRDLERENKTVILTTHNMEEADDLSENLAIIDHGHIIAEGTPQELKGKIGRGDIIEFKVFGENMEKRDQIVEQMNAHLDLLWAKSVGKETISFSAMDGLRRISSFYETLENKIGITMQDVVIRQNTLEDVFINLTGHELRNG